MYKIYPRGLLYQGITVLIFVKVYNMPVIFDNSGVNSSYRGNLVKTLKIASQDSILFEV